MQIIETESEENLNVTEQTCLSEDQKLSSHMAKVHYQKQNSRSIAEKAKECMSKLTNSEQGTNMIVDMNSSLQHSQDNKLDFIRETMQENTKPRKRKVKFTTMEDKFICNGLKRYGSAKWTTILNDPEYAFHPSQKASTLAVRAKSKGFI